MGVLDRFGSIVKANINTLLDKAEDPAKMVEQYLREMTEDLAEVRKETAGVMAEEARTKRLVDDCNAEIAKYTDLAKRALQAGSESDAKVFIAKKQELETKLTSLRASYEAALENASKMRELHDKLVSDIESLNSRKEAIKAKVAVAKTQDKVNKFGASSEKFGDTVSAFERMEQKADNLLDRANAVAELGRAPLDSAKSLAEKYSTAPSAVDDELAKLKAELGI